MGAEFNSYVYEGPESRLAAHHRRVQRDLLEQYGNDTYAGHIGIMPEGLDKALTPAELRDLMTYLLTERASVASKK